MKKAMLKAASMMLAAFVAANPALSANDSPVTGAASAAPEKQISLADAIENAKRATVAIMRSYTNQKDYDHPNNIQQEIRSTGVHIGDGYILASRHGTQEKIDGIAGIMPKELYILTYAMKEIKANYVGDYLDLDIALYRIGLNDRGYLPNAVSFSAREPDTGAEISTVGFPSGQGRITSYGRIGDNEKYLPTAETRLIQLDMSSCSGNSGGGVFNQRGEMAAMMQSIIPTNGIKGEYYCSHQSFAVPGPSIARAVEALKKGKHPDFSRLGVDMNGDNKYTKLRDSWKVAVSGVSGPAEKAGMAKGDVLLSIDGVPITSPEQLKTYLIEKTRPGQESRIEFFRNGVQKSVTVTLGHP